MGLQEAQPAVTLLILFIAMILFRIMAVMTLAVRGYMADRLKAVDVEGDVAEEDVQHVA